MLSKILKTQLHLLSINIGWTISSLILLPFYLSYLSPSDYGVLAILMVVITFGNFLSTANLKMGYTAFYFDITQSQRLSYLYQSLKLGLSISVIYLIIGSLFVSQFNLFLDTAIPSMLIMLALVIAVQKSLHGIYNVYLQHEKKTKTYSITNGTIILVNVIVQLGLLVFFDLGVASVIYGLLISYFIGNLMCLSEVLKSEKSQAFQFQPLLIYALSLFPFLLAEWFIIRGDRLIVEHFFDLEQVGIYALTLNVAFLLSTVGNTYLNAARPELFAYFEGLKRFRMVVFSSFFRALVLMILAGSIAIYLISHSVKYLTTHDRYQAIEQYITLALVIIAIRIVIRFFSEVFIYVKHHRAQNYLSIGNAVLFVIALALFYPYDSITSILYALLTSNLITLLATIVAIGYVSNPKRDHVE